MKQLLYKKEEIKTLIESGHKLILAGDERVLSEMPKGNWIAGTIPYFIGEQGGSFSQEHIYVTELPNYMVNSYIKTYNQDNIHTVYQDAPEHGFSVIIIPATSQTHLTFSLNAPNFPGFATKPLIGWISGVFLNELGSRTPKVFAGLSGTAKENEAVVLHIELPKTKIVEIGIVNIFEQGNGDTFVFPEDSFSATKVMINGHNKNFADYLSQNAVDTKLPLVANLYGAMINTSFQNIDTDKKQVNFYAPVFRGLEYKVAKPVTDYASEFKSYIPVDVSDNLFFSCNCILNYLYANLEGKKTAHFTGPITFGEVAYQLLNQTLAYLTIENAC